MVIVLVSSICVFHEFFSCIIGLDFWTRFLFLVELMVDHVSRRIKLGLMILVVGESFVFWVMVSTTCSDCGPVRVLNVDDGQFTA